MQIRFHPDVEKEVEDAVDWYSGLSKRLGDEFLRDLEQSLERIINFPEAWALFSFPRGDAVCASFPVELSIA